MAEAADTPYVSLEECPPMLVARSICDRQCRLASSLNPWKVGTLKGFQVCIYA